MLPYVNIHTHRPTGSGIELRTAGVHPWDAATQDAATLGQRLGRGAGRGRNGTGFRARRRPCGPAVRTADAVAAGPRAGTSRGAPLRQGLRAADARTGGLGTPGRDFPRASSARPSRRGRPWRKVTASRSANARSHRPRPLRRCAGRRFRSSFWRPTTAPCPSRKFTPGRRRRKGCRRRCCNGQF